MGLSGVAAAKLLAGQAAMLALTDDKPELELNEAMETLNGIGPAYYLGGIDTELLIESDLVVLSPGVPSNLHPVEQARKAGVEIISEIELAYSFCEAPLVAITGTNGKTTTTMLKPSPKLHSVRTSIW